jgi:transmembrane sensor
MTSRIEQLIERCLREEATEAERKELLDLLQLSENEEEAQGLIRAALEDEAAWGGDEGDMDEESGARVLATIYGQDRKRRRIPVLLKWGLAAAVLLSVVWGSGLLFKRKEPVRVVARQQKDTVYDIPPGRNKATLTLASGEAIELDDAKNGNIADDGGAEIVKAGNSGVVSYRALGKEDKEVFNTISTPRGGQYQVNLADGSKVWLNASSSLLYPTTFTGEDRTVELTGEAYFQIAKKAGSPFFVNVNGMRVEVLGTAFNINGYDDEPVIKTTLAEGAVRVEAAGRQLVLKPGQQAVSAGDGKSLRLEPDADLDEVLAWKNGAFNFNRQDIETVMRQISRWYDVDVVYEGARPEGHFSGIISRNTSVSTVLKLLEYGGVHFRLAGQKIVIMPN